MAGRMSHIVCSGFITSLFVLTSVVYGQAEAIPEPAQSSGPLGESVSPNPFPTSGGLLVPLKATPDRTEQSAAERPKRSLTPMSYFVPSTSSKTSSSYPSITPVTSQVVTQSPSKPAPVELDQGQAKVLRKRYSDIAAEKAAIMSLDELRVEIAEAEQALNEFAAEQALKATRAALSDIVKQFPQTSAGIRARKALVELEEQSHLSQTQHPTMGTLSVFAR